MAEKYSILENANEDGDLCLPMLDVSGNANVTSRIHSVSNVFPGWSRRDSIIRFELSDSLLEANAYPISLRRDYVIAADDGREFEAYLSHIEEANANANTLVSIYGRKDDFAEFFRTDLANGDILTEYTFHFGYNLEVSNLSCVMDKELRVNDIQSTSATLFVDEEAHLSDGYTFRYREDGTNSWTVEYSEIPRLEVSGLKSDTLYEAQALKHCNRGISESFYGTRSIFRTS